MSFVESNLLDGEEVVYQARLHWCIFIRPVLSFVFALVLYSNFEMLYSILHYFLGDIFELIYPIRIVILFVAIIYFVFVLIDYKTTEIFVTNKRISRKKGIISRITLDIKLNMIETVIFSQRIIGRIFNYGHVYFTGVGAMASKFHGIYNPLELRNIIIKKINEKEAKKNFLEEHEEK
jgi:uncharacterized membrane protein YdbT with pleckstrin-like domain